VQVAAIDPPQLGEPLPERGHQLLGFRIFLGEIHEHSDASHSTGLLRACRERPCRRCTANECELPPPHCLS